jgi:hypothetical protein
MLHALTGAVIGCLSGTHAASWGMYKDAPHEGFERRKYLRSVVLGTAVGAGLAMVLPIQPARPAGAVLLFGSAYAVERALAELYKTFFRREDQSKYTIPMQLAIRGRVIESPAVRAAAGATYFTLLLSVLGGLAWWQHAHPGRPSPVALLVLGAAGGWISALGGAWKDAPVEGFQLFKFFRSPALAALWAAIMAQLTPDLPVIMLAATGYTVATTETWKTFCFPSVPRGKFADKPVRFPALLRSRRRVVPVYLAIWLLVLGALGTSLTRPAHSPALELSHD